MLSLIPCKNLYCNSTLYSPPYSNLNSLKQGSDIKPPKRAKQIRCSAQEGGEKKREFLTFEESGLVEITGLEAHERFLCRLTISSLNLLRVISEQEGCSIEELNAGKVCDWFVKDKLKRDENIGSSVLQWDDSGSQF